MINVCDIYTAIFKVSAKQVKMIVGRGVAYLNGKLRLNDMNGQIQIEW